MFTTKPASHRVGQAISDDRRLDAEHIPIDGVTGPDRYTSAYLTKSTLMSHCPFATTVFLDADTLVDGPIDELIERAKSGTLTVTPYGRWTTLNDRFQARLAEWEDHAKQSQNASDWQLLIDAARRTPQPWVNAGVIGLKADHPFVQDWHELTMVGRTLPWPEETALQLLLHRHPFRILSSQFNCLPQLLPHPPDVRIWHFAGGSHLGYKEGRDLWFPAFEECCALDVAGVSAWSRLVKPEHDCSS